MFAFLSSVYMQSKRLSLSKNFAISNVWNMPNCFFSSFSFIQVFKTTRCSTEEHPGIPPSWVLGVLLTIFAFIFSVTRASRSLHLQCLIWIKRILFKLKGLPFFFQIWQR